MTQLDKDAKIIAKLSGEPEHLVMMMESVMVDPNELAQELAAAKEAGVREERERLTKNALESHNPDYLPSWSENKID